MSGFSADWLALRTSADSRSRSMTLERALGAALPAGPVRIVDIGSGTGSNLRHLAPRLYAPQRWTLVDHDPDLLVRAGSMASMSVETRRADLAEIEAALPEAADLVTCSALLDLGGALWIEALARAIARRRATVLAVLTYSGAERWSPAIPEDASVDQAFQSDMGRDKGLGPALGGTAADALAAELRDLGYAVRVANSDWHLTATRDADLIGALATGTADAVRPALGAVADRWRAARIAAKRVRIGHVDLLGVPPARSD